MQTIWLNRWGSWLVGVGGILFGGIEVVIDLAADRSAPFSTQVSSPLQQIEGFQIVALMILTLGLVGLYLRPAKARMLRTVGFLLAFVGTQAAIGLLWSGTFLLPYLAQVVPDVVNGFVTHPAARVQVGLLGGNLLFGIGWIVFAAGQLWVGDGSRLAWAMVIVAMLTFLLLPPLGGALLAIGLAWVAWSSRILSGDAHRETHVRSSRIGD
jgi:hypothetical protein